ncbi:MAG: CAAX prenyl protease-related protein [Nanoarchaeota archaeon]
MWGYFITLIGYLLTGAAAQALTKSVLWALVAKLAVCIILLAIFWKRFAFKFRFSLIAFAAGFFIFAFWILLGRFQLYPQSDFPPDTFGIILRIIIGVVIAPVIEEQFTRSFLLRAFIAKEWQKVPMGSFTWLSFIATTLFFGLAHSMWLAGIVAGIILNLLLYRTKSISDCILAHAVANALLAAYVIAFQQWGFW